jgi:tRNA G18 (ribose-2'-O)-methylase SpoU
MLTIESAQNEQFKKLLSLTVSKGLKKEGLFLLSGEDLIREFLAKPRFKIHCELVTRKLNPLTAQADVKVLQLTQDLFDQIDVVGTGFNIFVVEQPDLRILDDRVLQNLKPAGLVLVVPTGDPRNTGALIRSAEAFGAAQVILTEEAAHPFLPHSIKASAGSVLRIDLARGPALKFFPPTCLALAMDGVLLDDFTWPKDGFLVVGEEGKGLGTARFTTTLSIPMEGVESLNAVVAASVAMAFRARQMRQGRR